MLTIFAIFSPEACFVARKKFFGSSVSGEKNGSRPRRDRCRASAPRFASSRPSGAGSARWCYVHHRPQPESRFGQTATLQSLPHEAGRHRDWASNETLKLIGMPLVGDTSVFSGCAAEPYFAAKWSEWSECACGFRPTWPWHQRLRRQSINRSSKSPVVKPAELDRITYI
jgi:hypothetical protein